MRLQVCSHILVLEDNGQGGSYFDWCVPAPPLLPSWVRGAAGVLPS